MLSVIRPFFEVVKEGQTLKNIRHLQKVSFFIARFTPGFR